MSAEERAYLTDIVRAMCDTPMSRGWVARARLFLITACAFSAATPFARVFFNRFAGRCQWCTTSLSELPLASQSTRAFASNAVSAERYF